MHERFHERFLVELTERLFAHFTGGAWRAPLGARQLPVVRASGARPGARLGQIVCAEAADVARARGLLRAGGPPGEGSFDPAALAAALAADAPLLAGLRTEEGFAQDRFDVPASVDLPAGGPLVLLSAAGTPVDLVVGALIAGAARGLIWKPAPAAAASAHAIMRALGPRAGGRLALLQGDHATGQLLVGPVHVGQGGLVWAAPGPLPADLPPALILPARAPARR